MEEIKKSMEGKLSKLKEKRENLIAQLNMVEGAMVVLEDLLKEINKPVVCDPE